MLELRNVNTFYGNIQALRDVNIRINEGEIVTLIGANGAGKSTTLMTICGGTPPRSGEVLFRGHPIHTLRPNKIVALGISQVPEGRLIFPDLTCPSCSSSTTWAWSCPFRIASTSWNTAPESPWARRRKCARTPASSRRILESPTMLELRNVNTFYGNIQALRDVNIRINEGEIVTLIGANGAGKSTTLMTICGGTPPRSGEVLFRGHPIHTLRPNKIVALGISQVPEGRLIFPDLTVQENLDLGAFLRNDKDNIKKDLDYIFDLFPILAQRRAQTGGTLSGGEQQMLAISRAIMARPTLLLLDEPSLGLAPIIIQQIFSIIEKINADGTTVFLVEQNANQALRIANRAYVMENGRIVMEDSADKLLTDPAVQKAYLGM